MQILGIDPGIGRTGWGVINIHKSNFKMHNFGCIETVKDVSIELRLEMIYQGILAIIKKDHPDVVAIEELFFNTNAKTAMVVGQARGVVLLAAAQHKIPVTVYTPLQVKIAVTGLWKSRKKPSRTNG